jgi:hypothetical protein
MIALSPTLQGYITTRPDDRWYYMRTNRLSPMTILKVGGATIGFDEAKAWAKTYLVDRPGNSAYPAYDVSNNLIPVYYGLEGLLEPMNERLNNPAISGELTLASSETLDAIVSLFGILEEKPTKHVQLTTLSKVLHRKRPELLPLFDANIRYCYSECDSAPVPYEKTRSYAGYRGAWLTALQNDLTTQLPHWEEIAAIAPGPKITPLRALDIIGWELGNRRR